MWSRDRLVKPPAAMRTPSSRILVEPVRGRLEGEMRDAVAGDLVELPMQRDRIGRRQRAVDGALRRHQSDGADAGGGMAEPLPDLPREGGDRGLAAGAGHRRDGRGLARIKFRRGQRQRAARIWRDDERHAAAPCGAWSPATATAPAAIAASMKRAPSVLLPASAKNRSPGFTARLSTRKARHLDRFRLRLDRGVIAEEVAKFHDLPVRPAGADLRDDSRG